MNKYLGAVSANLVYFLINLLFFLAITPVSIYIMGPEFYGLWSILNAIIFMSGVGTLGMGAIVNKFTAEVHAADAQFAGHAARVMSVGFLVVFPMAILTAGVLGILRHPIAAHLQASRELQSQFSSAMLLIAMTVFPQFLARIPQGFLLSQYRNASVRRIETSYTILLWTGAVLIAWFKKDLIWIAAWCLVDALLLLLLYLFAIQRMVQFRFHPDRLLFRRMLGFSGFLFIESVAITLFQQMDRLIVGVVLGPSLAGVYAVGTSVGLRMPLVAGQVTDVMIPYASLKDAQNDRAKLYSVFRRLSSYISILMACLGGVLVLWMPEILSLWISPAYAASYSRTFQVLVIAYGLISLSRPAHQTLTGSGKIQATALIYSISTIAMMASLFLLARAYGFWGAALANFVPVILLAMNLYAYRFLTGRLSPAELFADLKWGILLPSGAYLFLLLEPGLVTKTLTTMVLSLGAAIVILRDDWARSWLIQQARQMAHSFSPDA